MKGRRNLCIWEDVRCEELLRPKRSGFVISVPSRLGGGKLGREGAWETRSSGKRERHNRERFEERVGKVVCGQHGEVDIEVRGGGVGSHLVPLQEQRKKVPHHSFLKFFEILRRIFV